MKTNHFLAATVCFYDRNSSALTVICYRKKIYFFADLIESINHISNESP